jgi:hypothetical protein
MVSDTWYLSHRKHVTVRVNQAEVSIEVAIDSAIMHGLNLLSERTSSAMDLVNVVLFERNDGMIFLTVIAEKTNK